MTDKKSTVKKSWIKILLIVSLGLNLAVAGLAIGATIRHHKGGMAGTVSSNFSMRGFMHALPENKREEVHKYFKQHRGKIRANRQAIFEAMVEIHQVILAKPFDEPALNAAFDAQRARVSNVTKDAQTAFVAIIAGMSDKEREDFVKTLEEQRRKWQNKHHRKPKPQ